MALGVRKKNAREQDMPVSAVLSKIQEDIGPITS